MNYQGFIPNFIGLIGVFLILLAYAMLQLKIWKADTLNFSLHNLIGSICIFFSLLFNWNLSSVVIEVIWMLISLYRIFFFLQDFFKKKTDLSKIDLRLERNQHFTPLSPPQISSLLEELDNGWEIVEGGFLKKTWIFDTYQKSIEFVNQVAEHAEKNNHHPVFHIEYKKITIKIWTHNVNALTKADYILASKISSM